MSVVIIVGGGEARNAITNMENASVGWTAAQRDQAQKLLKNCTDKINAFTAAPQPPA